MASRKVFNKKEAGVTLRSLPLLLLAGFFILAAVVLKFSQIWLQSGTSAQEKPSAAVRALAEVESKKVVEEEPQQHRISRLRRLEKGDVSQFPHNITEGDPGAPVRLVVFTDPACAVCRREVKSLLNRLEEQQRYLYVVYKYVPFREGEMNGGIFTQMARRFGDFDQFSSQLRRRDDNIQLSEFVSFLEDAGVPLTRQRRLMNSHTDSILRDLQQDITQAESLGVDELPTFFLNGYRLGQLFLPKEDVAEYVGRLRRGQLIIPTDH